MVCAGWVHGWLREVARRCGLAHLRRLQPTHCAVSAPAPRLPCFRWHEAGNVGVEHAVPGAIRAALAAPRRSDPSRQAFDRADLLRWRLAAELHVRVSLERALEALLASQWRAAAEGASWLFRKSCQLVDRQCFPYRHCLQLRTACVLTLPHIPPSPPFSRKQGGDVTARRTAVCAYLGLGACDGKQLLRQLNCYGFTHQEVAVALEWAERQLQTQHTSDGSTPPKGA